MLFDTLQLSEYLQESFPLRQALKTDVAALKAYVSILKTGVAALRSNIAALEVSVVKEISLLRADTIRWVVTAIGFNFLATAGLVLAMVKISGR